MRRTEPTSRLVWKPPGEQLGRAAADVEHERRVVEGAEAAPGQLGLVVAREQARREAVRPLDLAEKRLAVLRIADGARRDCERALATERLGLSPEIGEHVPYARDRHRKQAPPSVDAFAQPRDDGAPDDLLDAAVLDVGDEQACGVRPQVDRGDADHLRGTSPRTRARVPVNSRCSGADHRQLLERGLEPDVGRAEPLGAGRRRGCPLLRRLGARHDRVERGGRTQRERAIRPPGGEGSNGEERARGDDGHEGDERGEQACKSHRFGIVTAARAGAPIGGRASCSGSPRRFFGTRRCYTLRCVAGWSSQVARRAHNPEVAGSNPAPATEKAPETGPFLLRQR